MMGAKQILRRFLRSVGFDIVRYQPATHPLARRKRLLESYGIDVVLDVGANVGQYGKELRRIGYKGQIVSFEPLSTAFVELAKVSRADGSWRAMNYAFGDAKCNSEINISENSFSSSVLDMLPSHEELAPDSKYVGRESIQIKTLDSVFHTICSEDQAIYLKIDTQGFEKNVLDGAENVLRFIDTIQLEMSLIPLYQGDMLFHDMCRNLHQQGYRIVAIEPGFSDNQSGQLIQCDGIFHRQHHNV